MKYFNVILYILNTNTGREVQYNEKTLASSESEAIQKVREKHGLFYESDNSEPEVEQLEFYMKKGDITWYEIDRTLYHGINSKGELTYTVERNKDLYWERKLFGKDFESHSQFRNDLMDL